VPRFLPVPVGGQVFGVTMKQSRWRAKNKAPERRPPALLTLSRQQDMSRWQKI